MQAAISHSYLFGGNAPFIEELYEQYLDDPATVSAEWREYFDKLQQTGGATRDVPHQPIQESFIQLAKTPRVFVNKPSEATWEAMQKQVAVLKLISAYRVLGSRWATLDPLKRMDTQPVPELDPAYHGLTDTDMAQVFNTGSFVGLASGALSEILGTLKQTYCGNIGLEYMHIIDSKQKRWVQNYFEGSRSTPRYDAAKKRSILKQVTAAETLERYLHTKYVGQKRFSLEGGESMIAALDHLIQNATGFGVKELIVGMAHRGRLNVLVNTLGKLPRDLFSEFEGRPAVELPSGDVKYHMGYSSDIPTQNGPMHVSLAFNP